MSKFRATALSVGAVLVAVVTGCTREAGSSSTEAPAETPRNVRVLGVERTDLDETLELSGAVWPLQGTDLLTEEAGVVRAIPHDKGSLVTKGEVIVALDRNVLHAEMKASEADRVVAEFNEARTRNLYESNSISGQEMLLATSQLEKTRAAEAIAKHRYERAVITAPFDGLVTDRMPEVGELVSIGQRIARIIDPYTLRLLTAASDREVRYVQNGAPAEIWVEGIEEPVDGYVGYVGFEANRANGKFPVEIHVKNPDLRLRPGVVGRARILKRRHEKVVAVPRDAIVGGAGALRVFVADGDRARARDVSLGADEGVMVIVESGLEAGDRLVVRGQRDLVDGVLIDVREEATSRDGAIAGDPAEVRQR